MAYDAELAERLRDELAPVAEVTERKMFGGLAFLVRGHMTVVARGNGGFMARCDPADEEQLIETSSAEPVEMRGRPMRGWLHLDVADLEEGDELATWVARALAFTATLPPKT